MPVAKRRPPRMPHPLVTAIEARETAEAELDATLTELRALVLVLRRTGGYMPSADQVALRSAMARLAAHGRSVEV